MDNILFFLERIWRLLLDLSSTNDPRDSGTLAPLGGAATVTYTAIAAGTQRRLKNVLFASSIYWKGEVRVNGVTRYTAFGAPFTSFKFDTKGLNLVAADVLSLRYTNMSSLAGQSGSIYSTIEYSDRSV